MKREIEFRGKRIDNGEWVYGDLEYSRITDAAFIHTYYPDTKEYAGQLRVSTDTVGQSLELTDKKGKTLYEGDIYRDSFDREYVVEYNRSKGSFEAKNKQITSTIFQTFDNVFCEIIGNIHDNPELLEGGKQ